MLYKMRDLFREVRYTWHRIKRIIEYMPVLWKNFDWDCEESLLEMIRYKISRVRRTIETTQRHEEWQRNVSEMITAEAMITRYIDDGLFSECFEDFWERPETEMKTKSVPGRPFVELLPMPEKERKEFKERSDRHHRLREDEFREIFNYLVEHSRSWWD